MNCSTAKDWLLQAELPGELGQAPAEVAQHLRGCEECRRLVEWVGQLEKTWREQPLPASAEVARDDFLRRHDGEPARPSETRRRILAVPRWLVAASVLLAAGLTVYFMAGPQPVHAESDVIDRLIAWNLQMSEASPAERERIYQGQVASLRTEAQNLPGEDRAFADSLLQNGQWLVSNAEPVEEVDRYNALADHVLERLNAAGGDAKATAKLARYYERLATHGIQAQLARAEKAARADEARQRKLEKVLAKQERQLERLEKMHDAAPAATKTEIRQLIDKTKPKTKKRQGDQVTR